MRIAIASSPDLDHEMLVGLITSVPGRQVIWTTTEEDGLVETYKDDPPDLLLLDIGFSRKPSDCVRTIMQTSPCVVLLMTAAIEGNEPAIFEAMRWGAVDVATVPASSEEQDACKEFLRRIDIMHKLSTPRVAAQPRARKTPVSLIVIGASTGGPNAIRTILSDMPEDFQGNIVIVQHIDAEFLPGFASWLDDHTKLDVKIARDGDALEKGTVLVAQGPDDLIVTSNRTLKYITPQPDSAFTPSIDVFFKSCAGHLNETGVVVLLSGMGKDGVAGMKALNEMGWETIAQDEATSVIYGMPKEAAAQGAAKHIVPVQQIAQLILEWL